MKKISNKMSLLKMKFLTTKSNISKDFYRKSLFYNRDFLLINVTKIRFIFFLYQFYIKNIFYINIITEV